MYIYQNSHKYNQQDLCRLSLLFFFAEIRRCLFGAPCSRRIGNFVCFTEIHIHLQRKIGFGKPKILVSVRVPSSDTLELLFQINFQIVTVKVYRLYVTCKIHTSCIDSVNISLFMTSYGRTGDHSLSHR